MDASFLIKKDGTYMRNNTESSTNCMGQAKRLHVEEPIEIHNYHFLENQLQWIKDLNIKANNRI